MYGLLRGLALSFISAFSDASHRGILDNLVPRSRTLRRCIDGSFLEVPSIFVSSH